MERYSPQVLVSSTDEKYAPGLIVALASMLGRFPAGFEVDVVIYDDGMSERSRAEFARLVQHAPTVSRLHIKEGYSVHGNLPTARHVNLSTYSRLLIPEISPTIKRAVQFDADMYFADDISSLLTMDLGDAIFAACIDKDTPTLETGIPYSYEALGLPASRDYFNAGLLVIDVPAWREAGISQATMDYVRRWKRELRCPDQEGINAFAGQHGLALDRRFNFQVSGEGLAAVTHSSLSSQRDLNRVAGVHFTGPKPWLNVWFSSTVWARPAAWWWCSALTSPLISRAAKRRISCLGATMLSQELKRLMCRGEPVGS